MNLRIAILCNDKLAIPALNALMAAGMVKAVGMPDKEGETRLVILQLCGQYKVPIRFFTRASLSPDLQDWLEVHQANMVLVKTFPWKIPPNILTIPAHGFINFHYAPLPLWRGPHPLFWMIRYNVPMAGITVHRMSEQLDAGPILYQLPIPVKNGSTMGMLLSQLAWAGIQATNYILYAIANNSLNEIPQDNSQAGWYRRPGPVDLIIDWSNMPCADILQLIRACNPWNKGAATSLNGWLFAITEASLIPAEEVRLYKEAPGTIVQLDPVQGMQVMCCDGQVLRADIIYCEEGFFPGYRLSQFGIKKNNQLGNHSPLTQHSRPTVNT